MPGGILDSKQDVVGRAIPAQPKKQDFSDIFNEDSRMKADMAQKMKTLQAKADPTEKMVQNLNDQMSGKMSESKKVEKELADLEKYSEEDLKLAEELLFNGFARKEVKLSEKTSATLYSTNANEIAIVNELMFDFVKKYEMTDGKLNVNQKTIDHMNQLYMLAISFKGLNDKEMSESRNRALEVLKNAFKKLSDLEIEGDLEKHQKLLDEIKNAIRGRAAEIKRMSASAIDALSFKRYEFERAMYDIITRGDIIPKS